MFYLKLTNLIRIIAHSLKTIKRKKQHLMFRFNEASPGCKFRQLDSFILEAKAFLWRYYIRAFTTSVTRC